MDGHMFHIDESHYAVVTRGFICVLVETWRREWTAKPAGARVLANEDVEASVSSPGLCSIYLGGFIGCIRIITDVYWWGTGALDGSPLSLINQVLICYLLYSIWEGSIRFGQGVMWSKRTRLDGEMEEIGMGFGLRVYFVCFRSEIDVL